MQNARNAVEKYAKQMRRFVVTSDVRRNAMVS
jgi:hypothetical protein